MKSVEFPCLIAQISLNQRYPPGIHVASPFFFRPVTHCHLRQAIPVAHAPSALAGVVEDHIKDHLTQRRNKEPQVTLWRFSRDFGCLFGDLIVFVW